jgi:hypothetical protein
MYDNFFVEISKGADNSTLVIQTLFEFTKKINAMSADDLISFYQALKMLKSIQEKPWFRKNPILTTILDTQLIVIAAMKAVAERELDVNLTSRFNSATSKDYIRGTEYRFS